MNGSAGFERLRAMGRLVCLALTALVAAAVVPGAALGQARWEYTPYQVRVWIALEPAPQLPGALIPPLSETLAARSESVMGAVWQLQAAPAPAAVRPALLVQLESLTPDRLIAADKDCLNADKLYVASIAVAPHGYDVALREIDGRTRQLGPVARTVASSPEALGAALWDLIADNFTPLVRIERVQDDQVTARLRAGGLIVDPQSAALIDKGMVLQPVLRRNDRAGQPAKTNGISAPPWTLLRVEERTDSLLACKLFSGYRGVLPARGGVRSERLALLVRPRWESTRLVLSSRSDRAKPLAGYDIYSKLPEEAEPAQEGATDSFGSLELPRGEGVLQMLYVKNGRQLLARLPILPGQAQELNATLADDDRRLQAEGFVLALQSRALDLVARREIIAARFRARVKAGKFDEAQTLLEEFRKLETRQDLNRALNEAKQSVVAADRLTQSRIDKLFADATKLLGVNQLSDQMLSQLTSELTKARGGGAVASKATGQ